MNYKEKKVKSTQIYVYRRKKCKYIFKPYIFVYMHVCIYTYVPSIFVALVSNNDFSRSSKIWVPFRINETISKAITIYCYKCITNMCLLQYT